MANEVSIIITAKDHASEALGNVQSKAEGLSSTLTRMRAPALAVVGAVGLMGGASIKAASSLNEQRAAMEQVFKGSAGIVHAFAKDQADAYNVSQRAAFQYTAQLGSIFKSSGLAEDAAAGMSVEMVKLAADLASFKDISFEEALEKIRSGLVGESEPLRTVGVLLSAAEVEAKALEMGLGGANRELTEGEKVMARAAIITDQLADAQGDVERTAGSVANQMRDVGQKSEDLGATWGSVLLPISRALLTVVTDIITWFQNLPSSVQTAIVVTAGIAAAFAAVVLVLGPLIGMFAALIPIAAGLGIGMGALAAIFLAVPLAIAAVIAIGVLLYKNWDTIKEKAGQLKDFIVDAFTSLPGAITGPLEVLAKLLIAPFLPVKAVIDGIIAAKNRLTGDDNSAVKLAGKLDLSKFGSGLEEYEDGGWVPGPAGQPRMAVVHGGEYVIPEGGRFDDQFVDTRGVEDRRPMHEQLRLATGLGEDELADALMRLGGGVYGGMSWGGSTINRNIGTLIIQGGDQQSVMAGLEQADQSLLRQLRQTFAMGR
jgi:hypothetical protein